MNRFIITLSALLAILTNLPAHDYFPLEVGYQWEYDGIEVNDLGVPIPGTNYDSYMTIMGEIMLLGNDYFILHDSSNQSGYWELGATDFWREVGDTLKMLMPFFEDTNSFMEANLAILPRPPGTTWTVISLDTTFMQQGQSIHFVLNYTGEIEDLETVNVPAGTFANCYHLVYQMEFEMEFTQPETTMTYNNQMEVWLAFDVGPVKVLEFPTEGPGDPQPGTLQQLSDFDLPVAEIPLQQLPKGFSLEPPYPNPFNPVTRITFNLPRPGNVTLAVFDLQGNLVQVLQQGRLPAGSSYAWFEAEDLPSGIYLIRLQAEDFQTTQKLVLLK